MRIRISGGMVIDPGHYEGIADILVENGKGVGIVEKSSDAASSIQHDVFRIIDASGKIVTPGLIDMHVHLREPGHEHKETIASGCRAAARGGFSAVCCMPNTQPVNDSVEVTAHILLEAKKAGQSRVYPVGAVTRGLDGIQLCEFDKLKQAGIVAVSDDGHPVTNSRLMRKSLEQAARLGMPVISHSEDLTLAGGVMNEGEVSRKLGYEGIPNACESIMVMRDIALCELTGASLHLAHVSTAESVRTIRDAKARGVNVTAETAPHYFTLTDDAVEKYGTYAKMSPPLRSARDRTAIREALADGTIDVIATDHAPHSDREKAVAFADAANGIIGLETSLSLGLKLVKDGVLSLSAMVEKMVTNPARILGLQNCLRPGCRADITIIDPELPYVVDAAAFASLSRNTPFDGWHLAGKAVLTMVGGRIVYDSSKG